MSSEAARLRGVLRSSDIGVGGITRKSLEDRIDK